MRKMGLVVAVLSVLAAAAAAASFAPDFLPAAAKEDLAKIKSAFPVWTSVSMRVGLNGSFCDISEGAQRINLNGSRTSWGSWNVSGYAADQYLSLSVNPRSNQDPSRGYSIWGSGVSVDINPSGRGWSVWGTVDSRSFNLYLNPFGGSVSISGQSGLSLNASSSGSGYWVSGSVDFAQFDRKSLAVLATVLAATAPAK